MRRYYHIITAEKRAFVKFRELRFKHIKAGGTNQSIIQCPRKILFAEQGSASFVNEYRA